MFMIAQGDRPYARWWEFALVRIALNVVLITLLASCPVLCGSEGAILGLHRQHSATHSGGLAPIPAPANDDDCVCNGALVCYQAPVRVADLNPDGLPLLLHAMLFDAISVLPSSPATNDSNVLPNGAVERARAPVTLLPIARC
jgi:hypothetical protein